jgi:branched-chain amino acid transport system permease protein
VAAQGFNLVVGFTGQMAFGQAGFMAVGAYIFAVMSESNFPALVAALTAIVGAGMLAALVGGLVLRTAHIYLALVTMALSEATVRILQIWPATHGDSGIPVSALGQNYFVWAIVGGILATAFVDRLARSRLGRAYAMVRSDEHTAAAMGVNVVAIRVGAFTLSGVMGGAGGVLLASTLGYITPENFSSSLTLFLLTMMVVGGLASVWGAAIGAAVIVGVGQLLIGTLALEPIVYGLMLFVVLAAMPNGVVGLPRLALRLRRRIGRRTPLSLDGRHLS